MAATSCSGAVDLETLCMTVEKHPLLYDPAHPDVRDFVKRAQAWKAISKVVNISPANCKKHWRSVRDRFVREERLAAQADVEDDRLCKCSLYRHLGFLVRSQKARLLCNSDTYSGRLPAATSIQGRHGLPAQPVASHSPLQLLPIQLQAAQNPAPGGYDVGSECVILHPDAITQSVLLSMMNVPSPDEIITPDQPPTASCLAAPAELGRPVRTAPMQTPITIKQEPPDCEALDQFEGHWEDEARTSADSAQSTSPPRNSRRKRKFGGTGIRRGPRSKFATGRRESHGEESHSGDSDGMDVDSCTDALLRELATATEQMRAMADGPPHVDTEEYETMYLLSLRERLRKFGPREKSLALVRIQQVLHEIEFGTSAL